MRTSRLAISAFAPLLLAGCTSFSTVRSAEVMPGPSVTAQASLSTPVPDATGWFWSFDCAQDCGHAIPGGDVGVTWGTSRARAGAFALGVGMSGAHPYIDGYLQLGAGRQPFGLGVRLGPPVTSWREHQLYARWDARLGGATRLLLNPALFVHEGRSPNGENRGSFVGFVQGIGLLHVGERVSWGPSVAIVAGRARRTSYGQSYGPERAVFGTASLGMTWHRPRSENR